MQLEPLDTIELNMPALSRLVRLREKLAGTYREQFANYLQVFAGTGIRLGLQAVYFFVLANTLSLHDMGVFASTSATGIMIGCFAGFGFSSFAFRAAAGKRSSLGGYLAVFYVSWLITLPLSILLALPVFYLLFTASLSLTAFIIIILVEAGTWRIVEMIHQVNNGLGRYGAGSIIISIASTMRTIGAVAFMLSGEHDVETWALIYFGVNIIAMLVSVIAYQPRVRLRWRAALFFGRLRDGLMYSVAYCAFISQNEIDKLVLLSLADERTVGIYAIATRLIDFTTVPIRTFYVLYSRKLIAEGHTRKQVSRSLGVELVIALISTAAFAALVTMLTLAPHIFGHNVDQAVPLLVVLFAVPLFKNLLEYHSELFFAYQKMTARALLATSLVILKASALALLLIHFNAIAEWGIWLNAIYFGLYALSAAVVYVFVFKDTSLMTNSCAADLITRTLTVARVGDAHPQALLDLPVGAARDSLLAVHAALALNLSPTRLAILEAGGGSTSFLPLAVRARAHITVVDIDNEQIRKNDYAQEAILGDIQIWRGPPESFDLITCYNVIEHVPDVEAALNGFCASLKHGGLVLIGAPNPASLSGVVTKYSPHWFHVWFYRYVRGIKTAGQPGQAPFPTCFHPLVSLDRLEAFAAEHGLEVIYRNVYESPRYQEMRAHRPWLASIVDSLAVTINACLPGRTDVRHGDYHIVMRKR